MKAQGKILLISLVSIALGLIHSSPLAVVAEIWRFGGIFTNTATRAIAGGGFGYRSDFIDADTVNLIQAPAAEKRQKIKSISLIIGARTGSYADSFTVTFEVRDFSGNILRTVSASSIDLKVAPTLAWIPVSLSTVKSDLGVLSGEYLALHVSRGGPPGGDLRAE